MLRQRPAMAPLDARVGAAVFVMVSAYFLFEYVRPQDYLTFIRPLRIPLLLVLALGLLWLLRADKSVLKDPLVRLQLVFLGLTAIAVVYATNRYWVAQNTLLLGSYLAAAILPLASFMTHPRDTVRFVRVWILIMLFLGAMSLLRGGTAGGNFLGDANDMALLLNMGLPFAYFYGRSVATGTLARAFFLFVTLLLVVAVISTESRGGFLGLVAALGGIILYSPHKLRNITVLAALGLFVLVVFVPSSYVEEMRTIQNQDDSTRVSRLYYWRRGSEMFFANPVLGVGSGNYPWVINDYELKNPYYGYRERLSGGRVAHSLYFTLIPEYGLVGTGVFLGMVWLMFRKLARMRREEHKIDAPEGRHIGALGRASSASLLTFLVSGGFISVLYYPHVWYLMGILLALQGAHTRLLQASAKAADQPARKEATRRPRARLPYAPPSGNR